MHNRTYRRETLCLVLLLGLAGTGFGFVVSKQSSSSNLIGATSTFGTPLHALTERQLQFWEDVETGLDDIESYYEKKDQPIDKIRDFARRCVSLAMTSLSLSQRQSTCLHFLRTNIPNHFLLCEAPKARYLRRLVRHQDMTLRKSMLKA
mmetsp:Transcript_20438/g.42889  ORF Transcript_20438/g.42889 Transcript_20438/m.42889 type:complete len:149 (+) Transcript_20438:65-511(+)